MSIEDDIKLLEQLRDPSVGDRPDPRIAAAYTAFRQAAQDACGILGERFDHSVWNAKWRSVKPRREAGVYASVSWTLQTLLGDQALAEMAEGRGPPLWSPAGTPVPSTSTTRVSPVSLPMRIKRDLGSHNGRLAAVAKRRPVVRHLILEHRTLNAAQADPERAWAATERLYRRLKTFRDLCVEGRLCKGGYIGIDAERRITKSTRQVVLHAHVAFEPGSRYTLERVQSWWALTAENDESDAAKLANWADDPDEADIITLVEYCAGIRAHQNLVIPKILEGFMPKKFGAITPYSTKQRQRARRKGDTSPAQLLLLLIALDHPRRSPGWFGAWRLSRSDRKKGRGSYPSGNDLSRAKDAPKRPQPKKRKVPPPGAKVRRRRTD